MNTQKAGNRLIIVDTTPQSKVSGKVHVSYHEHRKRN